MKAFHICCWLGMAAVLAGCTREPVEAPDASGPSELTGIQAYIERDVPTRAGTASTVTALDDYVGRSVFVPNDALMFTQISRTIEPIAGFTYPGTDPYEGIYFTRTSSDAWKRDPNDGAPERIYWTDAASGHTFIAYSTPQDPGYDWSRFEYTEASTPAVYYMGSLGNPAEDGIIDYSLTVSEQSANTPSPGVYRNPKLEKEDLLICHETNMLAEAGGVALVQFRHGLSSIRVVVNISGFSSSSSAVDTCVVVSNMRLLHQPTLYVWKQEAGAQPVVDADMVAAAGLQAAYLNQRKDMKLWIPRPGGAGKGQSKTFTYYGITTPQPESYITTLDAESPNRLTELEFEVTYKNPLKPNRDTTLNYRASLEAYYKAGFNTTINISLNHRNEKMTVGAEYENWVFKETPNVSKLQKNSTFLQDTDPDLITIVGDPLATEDDATWLYEKEAGVILDIYKHTGSEDDPYQISTANQLLSFAYEVKNGRTFDGKFIRLDADITLQKEPTLKSLDSLVTWIGVGDDTHPFEGTFQGGNRFIYNLYGTPLFQNVGSNAHIQDLQVSAFVDALITGPSVTGSGLFAETNAGNLSACVAVGNVSLSGSAAGAFVGENTGTLYACYHIGDTGGTDTTGGLVGTNSGTIAHCFQAGNVTGTATGGVTGANTGTLTNNYYNRSLLASTTAMEGVKGKTTSEMTMPAFVTAINVGIAGWSYVFRPANYPVLGVYTVPTGWLETDLDQISAGDELVIVGNNGRNYAMANNGGASSAAPAVAITVEDGEITDGVDTRLQWILSVDESGNYNFQANDGSSNWMYCIDSDNYVKSGTHNANQNRDFTLSAEGYLQNVATSKYVGIYRSQDWRAYTSINNYIKNQTFKFYKFYDDGHTARVYISYPTDVVYSPDGAVTLSNVTNPQGVTGITYSSSRPGVALVNAATGELTLKGAGETTIRAAWPEQTVGDHDYHAGHFDYVLSVAKATPVIAAFDTPTNAVEIGSTVTNTTTISPDGLAITYTTSDDRVATVDAATGEVTGVDDGTAVISATFAGNENYNAAEPQTYVITVGSGVGAVQTYEMTLDSNASGNNNVHVLADTESFTWNTVTWTPAVTWSDDTNPRWGNSKSYLQVGTGDYPARVFSLSTTGFGSKTLVSVSVDCYYTSYSGSSNKPTLTITAGSTTLLPATAMTKTTVTTMTSTYEGELAMGVSDVLEIRFDSSVGAGLCISRIAIEYK